MPEAAAREAEEEAGVLGEIHSDPLGTYRFSKRMGAGYEIDCEVYVYPLAVTLHRTDWREKDQRDLRWTDLPEAPHLVADKGLMRLLRNLAETGGMALRARQAESGSERI